MMALQLHPTVLMRILISFILISLCIRAYSQTIDASEQPSIIMASGESAPPIDSHLSTELTIEFDHTQFIDDVGGQLQPETNEVKKKSLLIRTLNNAKEKLPPKVDRLFKRFGLPDDLKQFLINDYLLPKLEAAPEALENAIARGGTARINGVIGLGLSDYILNYLRTKKWGHLLPTRASFGFAFGLGTSVLFFQHEGKRKIMIKFFSAVERSDKVINWMSEAMATLSVGKVSDQLVNYLKGPRLFGTETTNYSRSALSMAGNVVADKNYFEYTFDLGLGLAIPGGFYDRIGKYRSLYIVINRDIIKDWFKIVRTKCQSFFQ